jgi:hypothetical protein
VKESGTSDDAEDRTHDDRNFRRKLSGNCRHEVEQFHVRFCFPDAVTADAFWALRRHTLDLFTVQAWTRLGAEIAAPALLSCLALSVPRS